MKKSARKKNSVRQFGFILVPLSVLIVLLAVFLPGQVLDMQGKAMLSQVQTVSKDTYASERTAMARRASSRLQVGEKLQLIDGSWESEISEAEPEEMELSEPEAVQLAREKMEELHTERKYPVGIESGYNNWYSFQATPYKAVETTFHTYGAYFWKIQFEKYDKSEENMVWILEDGTVFLAWEELFGGDSKWKTDREWETVTEENFSKWFPYRELCPELAEKSLEWLGQEEDEQDGGTCQTMCAGDANPFVQTYVYAVKYER